MAFEHSENTGSLFKNNKKKTEKHADYTGSGNIGGNEYWINAWVKETKNGQKFFSFSFREKEQAAMDQRTPASEEITDQDIPF